MKRKVVKRFLFDLSVMEIFWERKWKRGMRKRKFPLIWPTIRFEQLSDLTNRPTLKMN
jgi:hypothetical protein